MIDQLPIEWDAELQLQLGIDKVNELVDAVNALEDRVHELEINKGGR